MKKRFWCGVLAVGLLLGGLVGCNPTDGASSAPSASAVSLPEQPLTGEYGGQTITLREYKTTDIEPNGFYGFTEGIAVVGQAGGFLPVNAEGEPIVQQPFLFLYSFDADGRALAQIADNEWAYIDKQGKVVETAAAPSIDPQTEIYESSDPERFGVRDENGPITEPIFSWISSTSEEYNYATLAEGEHRQVMISPRGEVLVTLPDDCVDAYAQDEHIVCVYKDGDARLYRLADKTGKLLNDTAFSSISAFSDGLAVITDGGKLGLIAADGTVVIAPRLPIDEPLDYAPAICGDRLVGIRNGKLILFAIERK